MLLGLSAFLSACVYLEEKGGELAHLNVEIIFEDKHGAPVSNEPAYLAERIGSSIIVTEIRNTDTEGHLRIEGLRCLSLIVAVKGGSVAIETPTLKDEYLVVVQREGSPSLSQLLGKPNSRYKDYAFRKQSCG